MAEFLSLMFNVFINHNAILELGQAKFIGYYEEDNVLWSGWGGEGGWGEAEVQVYNSSLLDGDEMVLRLDKGNKTAS